MVPVNSLDQAVKNILRYQTEIQESQELARRMTSVHAWYAVKSDDGIWLFAPSKFIGYAKNTTKTYLSGAKNEMDGRDTERILQEWFRVVQDDWLDDALQAFLQGYGHSRPNAKARINILQGYCQR